MTVGLDALADGLKNNQALKTLNISKNKLANKEAGKALAEALPSCALYVLDVSSNSDGLASHAEEFAKELAVGLGINSTVGHMTINTVSLPVHTIKTAPVLDFSSKEHDVFIEDVIIIASLASMNVRVGGGCVAVCVAVVSLLHCFSSRRS